MPGGLIGYGAPLESHGNSGYGGRMLGRMRDESQLCLRFKRFYLRLWLIGLPDLPSNDVDASPSE
jgi:hypothetical protein